MIADLETMRAIAEKHGIFYWEVPEMEQPPTTISTADALKTFHTYWLEKAIPQDFDAAQSTLLRLIELGLEQEQRIAALERDRDDIRKHYMRSMAKQSATNKHLVEEIELLRKLLAEHTGGLKHV